MLTRNKLVAILCAIVGIIVLLNVWPAHAAEPIAARTMDRETEQCGESRLSGCFTVADNVCHMHIAPFGESWVPGHEKDHCDGMRHAAWQNINGRKCAEITEQGRTVWKPGMMMCVSDYRLVMVNP